MAMARSTSGINLALVRSDLKDVKDDKHIGERAGLLGAAAQNQKTYHSVSSKPKQTSATIKSIPEDALNIVNTFLGREDRASLRCSARYFYFNVPFTGMDCLMWRRKHADFKQDSQQSVEAKKFISNHIGYQLTDTALAKLTSYKIREIKFSILNSVSHQLDQGLSIWQYCTATNDCFWSTVCEESVSSNGRSGGADDVFISCGMGAAYAVMYRMVCCLEPFTFPVTSSSTTGCSLTCCPCILGTACACCLLTTGYKACNNGPHEMRSAIWHKRNQRDYSIRLESRNAIDYLDMLDMDKVPSSSPVMKRG